MKIDSQTRRAMAVIAAISAALAVFAVDLTIELGVAGAVAYILVIWLAFLSRTTWVLWTSAIGCSVLTLTGYAVSPSGGEDWKVLTNRCIALFAIWLTTSFAAQLLTVESQKSAGSDGGTVGTRLLDLLLQRTVLFLVLLFILGFGTVIWQQSRLQHRLVESSAEAEAKRYGKALTAFRTLYTRDVVETVRKLNIEVTHDFDSEAKKGKAIPLPATFSMRFGKELTQSELGGTRLYSKYPFPYPDRHGLDDTFAEQAWKALDENPESAFTSHEVVQGKPSLRYAVADLMRPSCVACHNSHPDSPKRDWKEGDVRGVLEVNIPLEATMAQTRSNLSESLFFFGALGLASIGLLGLVIGRIQQSAQAQTRLAAIVDSSNDAIIGKTLEGIVTSWNDGAERLYGYTEDEMVGQPITKLVPADRLEEVERILRQLRRGESVKQLETIRVHKEGHFVEVSLTISPILSASGGITGASTIARDIGELKRASIELHERDVRIQSLLNSTAEGIYGIDLKGNCTFANKSCVTLLGYDSPEEFLGVNMHDLIHHTRPDGTAYPMQECRIFLAFREGEGVYVDDEVFWKQDGSSFAAEYWSYPVREADEIIGSVVTFLDITYRKELEAEQRRINEELERRVEERTAELAKSKVALEQSNADLKQFAYSASHDLQTPLRGIANFAQFLKEDYAGKLDETADDYIVRIVDGAKRMKKLITDLLEYSRVESKTAPFQLTNLNEVFDDVLKLLQVSIEETEAEVTRDELPVVPGDLSQLSQLIQNLIGNALKYRSESPPRVHLTVKQDEQHWTFAVSDNGIGIDEKYFDQIFEIFRRLHSHEEYSGTGIGLAVCLRIVQRHGGKMWLESKEGKGSTFFFTIAKQASTDAAPDDSVG